MKASKNQVSMGPFFSSGDQPMVYCMVGDEPVMFAPQEKLPKVQQHQLRSMAFDIIPWSFALLPYARENDHVILNRELLQHADFFEWHLNQFRALGLKITKNIVFEKSAHLYGRANQVAVTHGIKRVSGVCYSYEMAKHARIEKRLSASRILNSKIQLALAAKRFQFQTPKSIVLRNGDVQIEKLKRTFDFPNQKLIVKADGLGGGFNVRVVDSWTGLQKFLRQYPVEAKVVFQTWLRYPGLNEFIADFVRSGDRFRLLNVRRKLTYENQWIGNFYSPKIQLNRRQMTNLRRCLSWIRTSKMFGEDSVPFGIDFLQDADEQHILEINGRWTGGMPVFLLLKKLGLLNEDVFSHVDFISPQQIADYQTLMERFPIDKKNQNGFAVCSVGFGPKYKSTQLTVWLLIFGDYLKFAEQKKKLFAEDMLPLSHHLAQVLKEEGNGSSPLPS